MALKSIEISFLKIRLIERIQIDIDTARNENNCRGVMSASVMLLVVPKIGTIKMTANMVCSILNPVIRNKRL